MKKRKAKGFGQQAQGQYISHQKGETTRLNKFISESGYCSRRAADRLIEGGQVSVDGIIAGLGTKVSSAQQVRVDGNLINTKKERVYIAFNKPAGVVSTTDVAIPGNLTTFMKYPEIIFPIGRLDKESTGLLLMTNDGDIVNKILREEYGHDKEYFVQVNKPITNSFLKEMSKGISIFNPVSNKHQKTKACKITQIDKYSFRIVLNQGLNRQIRRMCQALNYQVVALNRLRVMSVLLNDLPVGKWRYLSKNELVAINNAIK